MKTVTWIIKWYPRRWRERYQEEMLALLEQHTITLRTLLDLLLGAFEAHLHSLYRSSKEGSLLENIRDNRVLSVIYMCAVAVFFFSAGIWDQLGHGLAFQDNTLGSTTNLLGAIGLFAISAIGLIALVGITGATLRNAFKKRQWGTLLFALICSGLVVWILSEALPFPSMFAHYAFSFEFSTVLIRGLVIALLPGCGLFILGVKGWKLVRQRQSWPLIFGLLIGLLLPVCWILYLLFGEYVPNPDLIATTSLPGSFSIGTMTFSSQANFILFLWSMFGLFLSLGALLLALAESNFSPRSWRTARIVGLIWAALLVIELVIAVIWDVNRWVGGGVWIFEPKAIAWALFGDQWIVTLIAITLVLAIALAFALFALTRSFLVQQEGELRSETVAV